MHELFSSRLSLDHFWLASLCGAFRTPPSARVPELPLTSPDAALRVAAVGDGSRRPGHPEKDGSLAPSVHSDHTPITHPMNRGFTSPKGCLETAAQGWWQGAQILSREAQMTSSCGGRASRRLHTSSHPRTPGACSSSIKTP